MGLIPSWYSASTKDVAEKALERGILKYPAICYINDTESLAWITLDNTIKYIKGTDQITKVEYVAGNLIFFSGDKILYSYNILMSDEDAEKIIERITASLNMDQYITSEKMAQVLDNIIGDLGDKSTVVDYIKSLSYNSLEDVPIVNLIGGLSSPVYISSLQDGVYKIHGQYVIGGNNQTVQNSSNDVFFIVSKNGSNSTITQIQNNFIKLFFIDPSGNCKTDRYITEEWISGKNFVTSAELAEYVKQNVEQTIVEIVDSKINERLDVVLDSKLDEKITGIPTEELHGLFIK